MSRKCGVCRLVGRLFATVAILLIGSVQATASMRALPVVQENSSLLPHPAHMHKGTCTTGGELLVLLADVALATDHTGGTPVPDAVPKVTAAIPVTQSTTTIPIALVDLLAEPVSIEVHESALEPADVIACGDLGGTTAGADLLIGLAPIGPRGVPGIAWLRADGKATVVTIFLVEVLPAFTPTPAAPATAAASAETVTVTLGGPTGEFTISASQTSFRVGVPYHFVVTNAGVIPHEFMILPAGLGGGEDRDMEQIHHVALALIDEEDLPAGATGTIDVTFANPAPAGTLEFVCGLAGHYEGGMHLPIEVVA